MINPVFLTTSITSNLLKSFVNFVGPLVAIGLIVFVAVEAWGLYKGNKGATLKKLLGGLALFFLMIGTIYMASSYKELQSSSKNTVQKVVNQANDQATGAMDGNIN